MATNWSFIAAASSQTKSGTGAAIASPSLPNPGDLMICSWAATTTTAPFTVVTAIDGGSAGWIPFPQGIQVRGNLTSRSFWKIATAADFNNGSGITTTVTGSGQTGTITADVETDVFRLPAGFVVLGIDASGGATPTAATTTTWHGSVGASFPNFTDALAYSNTLSPTGNRGMVINTNTFAGTSAAAALAQCFTAGTLNQFIGGQYVGGVQGSATPGSNTWVNSWTNSVGPNVIGATFVYAKIGVASITIPSLSIASLSQRSTFATVQVNIDGVVVTVVVPSSIIFPGKVGATDTLRYSVFPTDVPRYSVFPTDRRRYIIMPGDSL